MGIFLRQATGWIPDPADARDLTTDSRKIERLAPALKAEAIEPPRVDLREYFPPVGRQGAINSCTAFTAAALLSYFERRTFDRVYQPSPLFLYKVERMLLHQTGDGGAYLRIAMKALRAFGAPPESEWPYDVRYYDYEPPAFVYALAANYKTTAYYRLDPAGTGRDALLAAIHASLAREIPVMFGFVLYPSSDQSYGNGGEIPFPGPGERSVGLHALVAAGYDDGKVVVNRASGTTTTGAYRVRNSWGPEWGDAGYGWLPYEYVSRNLATDWWSLIRADFLDPTHFETPGT
jgi:C1A family cysteine protease